MLKTADKTTTVEIPGRTRQSYYFVQAILADTVEDGKNAAVELAAHGCKPSQAIVFGEGTLIIDEDARDKWLIPGLRISEDAAGIASALAALSLDTMSNIKKKLIDFHGAESITFNAN